MELTLKIKSHPAPSFFVVAFLISWIPWFAAPAIAGSDKHIFDMINLIGACGPVFSAILIANIIDSEPSNASQRNRWIAFSLTFALTYALESAVALFVENNLSIEVGLLFLVYSSIAAFVVSSIYHPKRGVARVMAGLKKVNVKSVWIWAAVLLPFAWELLGGAVVFSLGGLRALGFNADILLLLPAAYPSTFFFGGPLTEEPGWRGFATPQIQERFSPLVTGLIIGVIWSTWHFPLYFTPFYGGGLTPFLFRYVFNVPLGVLFTWLYNASDGNLLATMLLHTSVNVSSVIFGSLPSLVWILLMIVTTVFVVLRYGMYKTTTMGQVGQDLGVIRWQKEEPPTNT